MKYEIIINDDKKCKRCGKGGATQGGFCLSCVTKNIKEGKYDHIIEKHRSKMVSPFGVGSDTKAPKKATPGAKASK